MTNPKTSLPIPDSEAQAHSAALTQHIQNRIQSAGGWLSFAQFMDLLLYAPGLGYYSAGAAKFGAEGDFITAPEISPLFGRAIARFIAPTLARIQDGHILEPGAGTGRLAASLLETLNQLGALPDRYLILEPSPSLQAIQQRNLTEWIPSLVEKVEWIHALPDRHKGVVIANEVLDAMPVHLMVMTDQANRFLERGIGLDASAQDSGFIWMDHPASSQLNDQAVHHLTGHAGEGYEPGMVFELGLPAEAWAQSLGTLLDEGQVVLIDYGFPAREFYHPQRRNGTLMCHYRHHAHDDPFLYPGLQDVTAHVDFTAIAQALKNSGLTLDRYQSQAGFLLASGILETLSPGLESGSVPWLKETTALQTLLSPAEMGELFKVLVASRGIQAPSEESAAHDQAICEQLGLKYPD